MPSSSRGRRALPALIVLLAIPVFGAGGAWLWIQRTAARRWAAAKLRIQELTRAFPDSLPPHPTTEVSKELQIHFVAAIREAARTDLQRVEVYNMARHRQNVERVDLVLGDAQTFLDRLHEGARRCATMPDDFPPGWRGEWDRITLEFIMNCCVLRARRQREKGAPFDAAETILDSLQLARFWSASGKGDNRIDALYPLEYSLNELRDILAREPFSRDQLLRLDRELEPLDAALRSPTSYILPTLALWADALETLDLDTEMRDAPYRWRYLLPGNLMKAEAFEFYDRSARRLLADEGKSYLDYARDVIQVHGERADSKNPILCYGGPDLDLQGVRLKRMAEIRVLRAAARYRARGEILRLNDPFGLELLHSRAGNCMKFWSLGNDGRNDGGLPGKDIVIEVPLNE